MSVNSTSKHLQNQILTLSSNVQCPISRAAFSRPKDYPDLLHDTALELIANLDKEELLENILERASGLTGTRHGYIYLPDPEIDAMHMRLGMGFFKNQLGRRVARGEGVGGRVWETATPLVVDDYRNWPGRIPEGNLDRLRSVAGIPLFSDSTVKGVIGLAHVDNDRRFTNEDLRILERFAALAVLALEKSGLYAEMRSELFERQRTEAVLRESESRYRTLLESSPDPIVVYDMQGLATYVNPAFEQIFGMPQHELLGKRIEYVPEENRPETEAAIRTMLSGQKINLFETRRKTRDGRILDVQISSTIYYDAAGNPSGNIVILRDISAQKQTERELQEYRDRLENLVAERTAELQSANSELEQQVEERKRAERTLQNHQQELRAQSEHLEEVNTALRVLLKQHEEERRELSDMIRRNVQELVVPYLEKMFTSRLDTRQKTLLQILETNLNNIISPFVNKLTNNLENMTPMEIRVADLIKSGKTNREIAEVLLISHNTVLFHRQNIRRKLNIKNKKINLRGHLLSMQK